jgi:hypothetical protein
METTLTKLAIMTASARVDLQVTTRRRHEFQWLDLAQKIKARRRRNWCFCACEPAISVGAESAQQGGRR